jgi:hypothetical protein
MDICSVGGCQKPARCRGLCGTCYQRERRGSAAPASKETQELSSRSIADLRALALDDHASTTKRLGAIDLLAAHGNFWITKRTSLKEYVAPTKRGRRFLRKALRCLAKTKAAMSEGTPAAIKSRLLYLKGVTLGKGLHQLPPPTGTVTAKAKPAASQTLSGIAAVLEQYEKATAGEQQ